MIVECIYVYTDAVTFYSHTYFFTYLLAYLEQLEIS